MIRSFARRRVLLGAVCVAGALGVSAAPAMAAAAQSAVGDFSAGPFSLKFDAHRAAGAPPSAATGTFNARMGFGALTVGTVGGPVTCLDVRGNRMGLFYPITTSSPSLLSMLHSGVFIYAQLKADGKPQSVSFLPVPLTHTSSCAPLPGLFPITSGTLTLTS
jgi:hypothetical protein